MPVTMTCSASRSAAWHPSTIERTSRSRRGWLCAGRTGTSSDTASRYRSLEGEPKFRRLRPGWCNVARLDSERHHVVEHRCGQSAAEVPVLRCLEDHLDEQLRIVRRRESDERCGVTPVAAAAWVDALRGARLAGHAIARYPRCRCRSFIGGHGFEHRPQLCRHARRDDAVTRRRWRGMEVAARVD